MQEQTPKSCGTCGQQPAKKNILIFSCSGAANVAEIADHAARQLTADGHGRMYCLAGLGAGLPEMVAEARNADMNVVIDGCPKDCARKIFSNHGITNTKLIRVTDLGITKAKGVPINDQQVQQVVTTAINSIGAA